MANDRPASTKNTKFISGAVQSSYIVDIKDDIINVDTTGGAVSIFLPNIKGGALNLYPKSFCINDTGGFAGTNPITIFGSGADLVNGGVSTQVAKDFTSGIANICNINEWLVSKDTDSAVSGIGGSGTVNFLPKFTAPTIIGDSQLNDNGTTVAIGVTGGDASAIFELSSTTQGFLPPRMTTAERDSIPSPATSLLVWNADTNMLNVYNGTAWVNVDTDNQNLQQVLDNGSAGTVATNISMTKTGTNLVSGLSITDTSVRVFQSNTLSGDGATISVDDVGGASFGFNSGALVSTAVFDGSAMTITDTINTKGLVYAADYSANYTNRSLVDKEYVDGLSPDTFYTANGSITGARTVSGDESLWLFTNTNFRAISGDSAYLEVVGDAVNFEGGGGIHAKSILWIDAAATEQQQIRFSDLGATPFNGTLTNANLTAARTWTLPDATGTIALLSDIPATPTLSAVLTAGNTTGANDISIDSGQAVVYNNSTFTSTISTLTLTANRVINFPDQSGTILLEGSEQNIYNTDSSFTSDRTATLGANIDLFFAQTDTTSTIGFGRAGQTPVGRFHVFASNAAGSYFEGFNSSDGSSAVQIFNFGRAITVADFENNGDVVLSPETGITSRSRVSIGTTGHVSNAKLTVRGANTATGNVAAWIGGSTGTTGGLQIQNDGRSGFGIMGATTTKVNIRGTGTTSATHGFIVQNSSGIQEFGVRDDGLVQISTNLTQLSGIGGVYQTRAMIAAYTSTVGGSVSEAAGGVSITANPTIDSNVRATGFRATGLKQGAFEVFELNGAILEGENLGDADFNVNAISGIFGAKIFGRNQHTGNNVVNINQLWSLETNTTNQSAAGFNSVVANYGGINVRFDGQTNLTATTMYGIQINTPVNNTGANITDTVGVWVRSNTLGTGNNYGFRQDGATSINIFQGHLTVGGGNAPTAAFYLQGAGATTATELTRWVDSGAAAKFIMRDDGSFGMHGGGTAAVSSFAGYFQSTGYGNGYGFYARTGSDKAILAINAASGANGLAIDAQFQNSPTGTAIAVRGLSWQTTSTTNIGIQGSARNGISFNVGVDGLNGGGASQAPSTYNAAVRGLSTPNLNALSYGGYFSAAWNSAGTTFNSNFVGVYGTAGGQAGAVGSAGDIIGGMFLTSGTQGTGDRIALLVPSTGNNGTIVFGADSVSANASMLEVTGDVEIIDVGSGYIVKSPDSTRWRITVSNAGAVTATSL